MAVYGARAVLQGKGHDVWEMVLYSCAGIGVDLILYYA
jgi:hypothetical protein